jgi:hypothetical protein
MAFIERLGKRVVSAPRLDDALGPDIDLDRQSAIKSRADVTLEGIDGRCAARTAARIGKRRFKSVGLRSMVIMCDDRGFHCDQRRKAIYQSAPAHVQ